MILYLASPYSHPEKEVEQRRFDLVTRAAGWLMQHGFVVFSPISHSHPVAQKTELPRAFWFWRAQDLPFMRVCDELYVLCLPDWDKSIGVAEEIAHAKALGIPITYMTSCESCRGYQFKREI